MRRDGRTVVLTNGCFDLLHVGHVRYLEAAAALGDVLVVGVNDDDSVRRLKGSGRPVNPAADRAEVVAALSAVDAVTIFGEDTAAELAGALAPDVYVKGGDYSEDPAADRYPPEAPIVESLGGRFAVVPLIPGRSTTATLDHLHRERAGG